MQRLTGVDQNASVMPTAMQTVETPASTPRWEPLQAEVWLGDIQRFNGRLEGHEAIVALELVEHLEPHILSRFGVVTLGTYRPKLMLVSTPVSHRQRHSPSSLLPCCYRRSLDTGKFVPRSVSVTSCADQ
jgi:hypothetical protein